MKLRLDDYTYNRPLIKKMLDKKGSENYQNLATEYAVFSDCPIIATYVFMGELIGFSDAMVERMRSYSGFYGYAELELKERFGNSVGVDMAQFIKKIG